ncbi:MAG: glycerol acyltransferase [Rhodobacterales bacterium]|nr:MAG: glycerol acyltransferase [Rhodobacterales bacterium]
MKDRIDPLIAERAPWLFRADLPVKLARLGLNRALSYNRSVEIGEQIRDFDTPQIMQHMADMLCKDVTVSGLEHIPRQGAALIVANHPTGIADGIILDHALRPIRSNPYYYANGDILRVLPQMDDMIIPVEWRKDRRSHGKTRETMRLTREAVEQGRLGVIFPSGRLAKRRGLRLFEREWMPSAAMLARKYKLPVIPVHLQARNSALFYLFDAVHPTLRDITLFHETLNKDRQPYTITVGEPISPGSLPANSDEGIEILRRATLALGDKDAPGVSLVKATKRPVLLR